MNTANIKRYAPKARTDFIAAVTKRAQRYGVTAKGIEPASVSGEVMQIGGSNFPAAEESARKSLIAQVERVGFAVTMEQAAYSWFNRLCAIRYMELHGYFDHGVRVLSHPQKPDRFEILEQAQNVAAELGLDRERVVELALAGTREEELYRYLLLGQCHALHHAMPFLFDPVDSATELLLPDNLTRTDSLIRELVKSIPEEDWQQVEIVGWLYQFYISEKKDQVMGKVVNSEDIPAATQLFTPNWIVKYLVQNSLGRLWLLNYPESTLVEQMEYYIGPVRSGKWEVGSEGLTESEGGEDGGKELSGADCLAEGDGSGGAGVSGDQSLSERGALRIDQSGEAGGGFNPVQHSRRSGTQIDSGVQEFSVNSAGIKGGGGNADHHRSTVALSVAATDRGDSGTVRRDQKDDLLPDSEAVITSHSPLPTSHLRISSPEEIRICDPACGSGHILVEAYKLLRAMYEERGYRSRDIPKLILENNLFGLDIDDRAGQLAGFALMMLAREDDRRLFSRDIKLNILSLQETGKVNLDSLWQALNVSGKWLRGSTQGLFGTDQADLGSARADSRYQLLERTLEGFAEAKTFGSLIDVPAKDAAPLKDLLTELEQLQQQGDAMQQTAADKLIPYVKQAWMLALRYHVVVANPPYMGGKGMNLQLKAFAAKNFPDSKSDLFAIFMERSLQLTVPYGDVAMITMQSWMFLSSFEKLRIKLLDNATILSMAHLGARGFDSIGGEVVQTTAFVLNKHFMPEHQGAFLRLTDGKSEAEKAEMFKQAVAQSA